MGDYSKIAVAVVVVFFVGCVVVTGLTIANYYSLVYPTPENQSAFYQTYDLDTALKSIVSIVHFGNGSEQATASAGEKAATLHREINKAFGLQGLDRRGLMALLSADILLKIEHEGAQVTEISGSQNDGFHFRYVKRNGTGTVTLKPVGRVDPYEAGAFPISRPGGVYLQPLHNGELPVKVTVVIDEAWSRPGT